MGVLLNSFRRFRVEVLSDSGYLVLRSINLRWSCTFVHVEYLEK